MKLLLKYGLALCAAVLNFAPSNASACVEYCTNDKPPVCTRCIARGFVAEGMNITPNDGVKSTIYTSRQTVDAINKADAAKQ
ncbi:MAG: hypothetical protein WB816_07070 [Methylocystis sp.]